MPLWRTELPKPSAELLRHAPEGQASDRTHRVVLSTRPLRPFVTGTALSDSASRDVGTTAAANRRRPPLRRLDQAAGAADATREARSIGRVACGSQEVSCDPLSADHAGGAPAPQLRSQHDLNVSPRGRAIRSIL